MRIRSVLVLALVALGAAVARGDAPWPRHTIDDSSRGADGVRLADVNADGRPDIVTGWEQGGVTRVYLNPGPAKAKEKWPAVTVGKTPNVEDAVFSDLDGDRAADVVTCCEGRTRAMFVHWAPKDKSRRLMPDAWKTEAIPAAKGAMMWMFCVPAQIDGRRGIDLVAAGKGGGAKLGWFEAPENPRELAAWKWHPLLDVGWIMSLVLFDMDGDGDADILATDRKGATRGCFWLENPGPGPALAKPWHRHDIGGAGREVMFLAHADLDGDGRRDVLVATKPRDILFFRRTSKDGKAWQSYTIRMPETAGTAKAVSVGDIDLDGKPDIVFSCEHAKGNLSGVMWLSCRRKKVPGKKVPGTFSAKHPPGPAGKRYLVPFFLVPFSDAEWDAHDISGPEGVKYDLVELVDLDADGDLDVLTCEEAANLGVIWYENPARRPAK